MNNKTISLCAFGFFSVALTICASSASAFEKPKPAWHEPTISAKTLLLAVGQEDFLFVRWLLQSGADVNTRAPSGATPLIIAARTGNNAIVRLLMEKGADVNAINFNSFGGETALMIAASQVNLEAVELLLAHGADVNVAESHGVTALIAAQNAASRYSYRPGTLAAFQLEQYEKSRQTVIQVLKNAGAKEYNEREFSTKLFQVPHAIEYVRVGANIGF